MTIHLAVLEWELFSIVSRCRKADLSHDLVRILLREELRDQALGFDPRRVKAGEAVCGRDKEMYV